jgi:hypothetical protein
MNGEAVGRFLVLAGLALVGAGLLVWVMSKLPFFSSIGSLPGDFVLRRGPLTVFLPLGTMLLVSLVLTVVVNLVIRFLRH